ncbi:hypothetical protein GFO_1144 [Christiangramia forsetii KT0803]|uniref:Uncharacterized protein n=1 Tax=Christiangramia forsetii (strain DSM 17595 / CGMCC 1.15422 / KT0803) TaxID=411154 RepID=A0M0H3_CHRFK|nr:hypothetical protein GFO_1144 [Christiangramia forsetii KT0803]
MDQYYPIESNPLSFRLKIKLESLIVLIDNQNYSTLRVIICNYLGLRSHYFWLHHSHVIFKFLKIVFLNY